ncbi:hypothetical protein ACJJTC_005829 [Scirpophaga incertulas]
MSNRLALLVAMSVTLVAGQRPSFAGSRPIGYPELITTTTEGLGNRFGEDDIAATTQRLPIEANGDKNLIDRLSKLPIDKQPFWLINWQAYEAHRQNPQTFPQKPNVFVDPMTGNSQINQFNQGNVNQQPNRFPSTNVNPQISNRNFETVSNLPLNQNMNQFVYPNNAFNNQQPNRLPTHNNVYPQNQFQNSQSFGLMNQNHLNSQNSKNQNQPPPVNNNNYSNAPSQHR